MTSKNLIAALLSFSAFSALPAIAQTKYFIVVPVPGLEVASGSVAPAVRPAAVAAPLTSVTLASSQLSPGELNKPYSQSLMPLLSINESYAPSDVAWSLGTGNLPSGMSLEFGGLITGAPDTLNAIGSTFQVLATYKSVTGQQTFTIAVHDAVLQGVTQIVTGGYGGNHTCVLLVSGGVKCWGSNNHGQLGDGTNVSRLKPVNVIGLSSGVTHISVSANHSCAVVSGAAKCWGYNGAGELGDGSKISRFNPEFVTGLLSGVTQLAAGANRTCGIVAGAALCWGWNGTWGVLGDGTTTDKLTPVAVSGLSAGVSQIAAGLYHSCAIVAGAARCWGWNGAGQLGNGLNDQPLSPVYVLGLYSGVKQLTAGYGNTCAVVVGAAKCWGYNANGELGDGTKIDRSYPVAVSGLTLGVTQISMGSFHTCAVVFGAAQCWGNNQYGQLGDNTKIFKLTPTPVIGLTSNITQLAAGTAHTCALGLQFVRCWGGNPIGQLGDGTTTQRLTPVNVTP